MTRPRNEPRQQPPKVALETLEPAPVPGSVFRSHLADRGPWFFSSVPDDDIGGRWDLPRPEGTCHVGTSVAAALWERLGPDYHDLGFLSEEHFDGIEVTSASLVQHLRLADLTGPRAPRHGVTSELFTTSDNLLTQTWAKSIRESGWDGLKGTSRFATGSNVVAVFGPAGEQEGFFENPEIIPDVMRLALDEGLLRGEYAIPEASSMQYETPN